MADVVLNAHRLLPSKRIPLQQHYNNNNRRSQGDFAQNTYEERGVDGETDPSEEARSSSLLRVALARPSCQSGSVSSTPRSEESSARRRWHFRPSAGIVVVEDDDRTAGHFTSQHSAAAAIWLIGPSLLDPVVVSLCRLLELGSVELHVQLSRSARAMMTFDSARYARYTAARQEARH